MLLSAKPYLQSVTMLREKVADFNVFPFCLPIVRNLERIDFHADVTFFVGDNGSGKSTLIEALAILMGFNPEGGTKNFKFSTRASHSPLHDYLRISKSYKMPQDGFFLRAESFYNVATNIDEMDEQPSPGRPIKDSYGGKSLHKQSHGESFWALMTHRFGGKGIYILDEPEAALSPTRQLAMLSRMDELVKKESQFIVATHSPILLSYPRARIYEIREGYLCDALYEETEHYRVMRHFMSDYRKQLGILLEEQDSRMDEFKEPVA